MGMVLVTFWTTAAAHKDDDIDFDADEFLGRLLKAGQVVCWAALEDDVLPLDPPEAP